MNNTDHHITTTKQLRKDLDEILQRLKDASDLKKVSAGHPVRGSRERSLAVTKLQESIMWLGMDLKDIGEANPGTAENPYPNSKDPSNTVIDPTADKLKL